MTTEYAQLNQEITRRIVAAANPVKVILFGSRARGTTHRSERGRLRGSSR